jgi:transcriptional regulator with PAS, ATPase and Fis domain
MNNDLWAEFLPVAITVMDENGTIIFMNEKSKKTFAKYGGGELIGKNLFGFHKPEAVQKIKDIAESGKFNCYTIEKDGIKKMIYQTPWFKDDKYAGLVEISMEIPFEMEHFVRG